MHTKFYSDGFKVLHENHTIVFNDYGDRCSWTLLEKQGRRFSIKELKVVPYKGTNYEILAAKARKRIAEIA